MNILVVDAGTSSTRTAVVTPGGQIIREVRTSTPVMTPSPGLVEFDAAALAANVLRSALEVCAGQQIAAVGVTSQRASTVLWDRATGEPVGPGIGWQDNRTTQTCVDLADDGIRLAPNQSPTKAAWLWDAVDAGRHRDLCTGTIDSWLVWTLTNGHDHITDRSNAFTSGFLHSSGKGWEHAVLDALTLDERTLPTVVDSMGVLSTATVIEGNPRITAIAGDQQASMFGQGCVDAGMSKATFGTGGSLNVCVGATKPTATTGSFPIVAWSVSNTITWGLEAIMLSAGSCIDWLCDVGLLESPADASTIAEACENTGDVWFVPALGGLGTPYWDLGATGMIIGATRGTERPHLVRAVLEGIAHRGADLLEAVRVDIPTIQAPLRVDGGMSANHLFLQLLADACRTGVEASSDIEATTRGVAMMAAVGAGLADFDIARNSVGDFHRFEPAGSPHRTRWAEAVARSRSS
jgi:glycerol kinase